MSELLSDVQLKRLVFIDSVERGQKTTENSLRTKFNEETVCPHIYPGSIGGLDSKVGHMSALIRLISFPNSRK